MNTFSSTQKFSYVILLNQTFGGLLLFSSLLLYNRQSTKVLCRNVKYKFVAFGNQKQKEKLGVIFHQ